MKTIGLRFLQLVVALLIIIGGVLAVNYFGTSLKPQLGQGQNLSKPSASITVLNWNLGYAGLGKASDFVADGGKNFYPPSKQTVERNLAGIQSEISQNPANIYLFQEISESDMLTLGVDVLEGVRDVLSNENWFFTNDISTRFIPRKNAMHHGLATFSGIDTRPVNTVRLPNEPTRLNGFLQRQYHIQVREFTDERDNQWAVINIHLSAFDEGGNIRVKQLEQLLDIVDAFYQEGKHVVVGGDWNMQLTPTDFPYTTDEKYLFWVKKLPYNKIKPGWKILFDPKRPTIRTNERPYIKGENYTTIIDGFLISPNVEMVSIKTIDTDFQFTDHQAVWAEFTSKP